MARQQAPPEGFVERLREAMEKAGVNQRELARRLRVHESAVSKWFGEPPQAPSLRILSRFPEALPGTSVDWLVGVKNSTAPVSAPKGVDLRAVRRLIRKLREAGDAATRVAGSLPDEGEG
jgi:transcriptional regulator with XRE-family HTH domain